MNPLTHLRRLREQSSGDPHLDVMKNFVIDGKISAQTGGRSEAFLLEPHQASGGPDGTKTVGPEALTIEPVARDSG